MEDETAYPLIHTDIDLLIQGLDALVSSAQDKGLLDILLGSIMAKDDIGAEKNLERVRSELEKDKSRLSRLRDQITLVRAKLILQRMALDRDCVDDALGTSAPAQKTGQPNIG